MSKQRVIVSWNSTGILNPAPIISITLRVSRGPFERGVWGHPAAYEKRANQMWEQPLTVLFGAEPRLEELKVVDDLRGDLLDDEELHGAVEDRKDVGVLPQREQTEFLECGRKHRLVLS